MNPVEIEAAVSTLAEQPFDAAEFPFAFLQAFGNKETTIKRLRAGSTNGSDVPGGVLQRNNIHIAVAAPGAVAQTLAALRLSPATAKAKAKFILATDGETLEAEDIQSDDPPIACAYTDFPNHFGFFLPLAGITTVKQIRESSFDIRATGRLNRLYVELLKDNPDWGTSARRPDMNHFMARLIFCFFAEDTDIFNGENLFTATIEQMSARDSSDTHEVISELFRAMNTPIAGRANAKLPRWADIFPYVNGGLFSGSPAVPRFTKIARSYLLHIGSLDWTKINPDIFGSMIQAVADDEERGALGMHYTSVPNILKVLNPLFLDDLRARLEEAGDNGRMLLNLRRRMARIRVFDPACGSGNFLVIAYKEMRAIEAIINQRRGEADRASEIPLTNFRGIELRDFPAEVARLALIIAEYQADVLYRGQKLALAEFLPLNARNWITCGNALQLDWLSVCEPTGSGGGKIFSDDLFGAPLDQAKVHFENSGGEVYVCGNPPFSGSVQQTAGQKADMANVFADLTKSYKDLDYVSAFHLKAAQYNCIVGSSSAFVSTNSICQGEQVAMLWPLIFKTGNAIFFAYTSFLWKNLASNNAGVTCAIIGISPVERRECQLISGEVKRLVPSLSPYLIAGDETVVVKITKPISRVKSMVKGNAPNDGGNLILERDEKDELLRSHPGAIRYVRRLIGARDFIQGGERWCLWITDKELAEAKSIPGILRRIDAVKTFRENSSGTQSQAHIGVPHKFVYAPHKEVPSIIVPRHPSEHRDYLTAGLLDGRFSVISDSAIALYGADLASFALVSSRMHIVWVATVCGKLKTDYRYSNTLGWNTFPVPTWTEKNETDLVNCAQNILLTREAHFPMTIADLYDRNKMPADLREAHECNDEVLERIYIGRRFRNDTERLEKLFELYSKMIAEAHVKKKRKTV